MTKKNYNPSKAHQDAMKKPEPNPIEEAIGDRAKTRMKIEEIKKNLPTESYPKMPDEPTPSEMLTLEELNHETVERLQDQYPEEPLTQEEKRILQNPEIPVSKPESQPVTKTCSPESPPQESDTNTAEEPPTEFESIDLPPQGTEKSVTLEELHQENFSQHKNAENEKTILIKLPEENSKVEMKIPGVGQSGSPVVFPPAEDKELTNLKKYIMGSGFVVTGVAYHIVALCSQPMTTPCTTTWDFKDRAMIPEMVFTLLRQPGYLEGIWPSLKVIMSSNIGNDSWCAGICTTIAFFDVIRTLPAVKELAQQK